MISATATGVYTGVTCTPGDRLYVHDASAYESGDGTHVMHTAICASVVGHVFLTAKVGA